MPDALMQRRWLAPAIFRAWRRIAAGQAAAQDVQAGRLLLTGASAKATEGGQRLTFAFATIRKRGGESERLRGGSSSTAIVELREPDPATADGARTVTEGFLIAAGDVLALEPGTAHSPARPRCSARTRRRDPCHATLRACRRGGPAFPGAFALMMPRPAPRRADGLDPPAPRLCGTGP